MGDITLKKALDDYKTVYMPYRNFAVRTRVEYQNDLVDLVKYAESLGVEHVSGLGLAIIHRYVAQLEERGYASLTRKRKVVAVRSFLLFLFQDGYTATNISEKIIVPFTETATPYVLTESECERLRNTSASNPRDVAIIELLLQTGIRLSELVRLTLDDVEIQAPDLTKERRIGSLRILASRGRKERTVLLNAKACQALRHYLHGRKQASTGVLLLNRFGEPLGERGVQKIFRKYLKKANIQGASVHTLRHTFGAQCIARGMDLEAVHRIMGNNDKRSTAIYLDAADRRNNALT